MATPGASVAKRLNFFGHGFQNTIQRAGSVISNSLRSCDDASEVLTAGNEFLVNRHHDGAERRNNGAESLSKRLSAVSQTGDTFKAQIWGDHQFKLSMKWLAADGKRPGDKDSISGSIAIQGYLEGRKTDVPLRIVWQRKCADQIFPINFQGQNLPITADDVCCSIRVQVTCTQSDMGTAFGELGPFEIDAGMRNTIQDYIHNGGSTFPVEMMDSADLGHSSILDADERSYQLQLTPLELRLSKPGSKNGYVRSWVASMSSHKSIVDLDLGQNSAFKLNVKGEESKPCTTVRVAALSRRQRDTIVLTIRAFQAAQVVNMFTLLEQVAFNTQRKDSGFETDDSRRSKLDFYVVFDQLNRQTIQALTIASAASKEKNRAVAERDALEQDINATIEMYQRLLADASATSHEEPTIKDTNKVTLEITQRAALIADLQTQLRETSAQAKKYCEELELIRRDYRELQSRYDDKAHQLKAWLEAPPSKNTFTDNGQMRVIELEGHLRNLEQMNLTADKESRDLRRALDVSRAAEGKADTRLKDMEAQVQKIEFAKEEAERNFLYIKEKYNDLEKKQKAAAYASIETSGQVERAERESRRELEVYQTRMRDLELQMEDQSRRVENLMMTESKLRKQNDSLTKQLDKLREGGGQQTQQLIDLNRTLLMSRGGGGMETMDVSGQGGGASDELRAKLAAAEKECAKLRAENDELKRKCRKLAAS